LLLYGFSIVTDFGVVDLNLSFIVFILSIVDEIKCFLLLGNTRNNNGVIGDIRVLVIEKIA